MTPAGDAPGGPPARTPIATQREFHAAVRAAIGDMAQRGCREAWFIDEDFADWPLGERAVVELLAHWAGPRRRLVVIARHYDEVVRRHPRWVDWRRHWAHIVECRALEDSPPGALPCLLLAGGVGVHLAEPLRHRGVLTREPATLLQWREAVDAVSQRSVPAFGPGVLGL